MSRYPKKKYNSRKEPNISVIQYNDTFYREYNKITLKKCLALELDDKFVTWININKGYCPDTISQISARYGLDGLTAEYISNMNSRGKVGDFRDFAIVDLIIFSLRMRRGYVDFEELITGHSYIIIKNNLLISIQEKGSDVFQSVRNKIKEKKSQIIHQRADYLLYSLIDAVVNQYAFIIMCIEHIEQKQLRKSYKTLNLIFNIKLKMKYMHDCARAMINTIKRIQTMKSTHIGLHARHYMNVSVEEFAKDISKYSAQSVERVEASQLEVSRSLDKI